MTAGFDIEIHSSVWIFNINATMLNRCHRKSKFADARIRLAKAKRLLRRMGKGCLPWRKSMSDVFILLCLDLSRGNLEAKPLCYVIRWGNVCCLEAMRDERCTLNVKTRPSPSKRYAWKVFTVGF